MPLSAIAKETIAPLMEQLVVPQVKKIANKLALDYKRDFVPLQNHLRNYFERTYERLFTVNTIALKNTQKSLKDIYIPLTILSHENDRKPISFKIDSYPKTLINKYKKILITDTAGMGKSTMMKKIFIDIVEKHQAIPIFIELRRLSKDKTILEEILEQLDAINKKFDPALLVELLVDGGFLIILDGYDEISLDDKVVVTSDIQDFISKTSNNNFIMTSRPEQGLTSFSGFKEFKISPLKKQDAFKLLRKYDRHGEVSKLLITKLEETNLEGVEDFMTNPLLVSLLFTAFEYKQSIPLKKHLFYRQVFDAYFEGHDITKGDSFIHDKYTKLGIDEFDNILRYLGYLCFKKQKIEFSKDELLALVNECCIFCKGITFKASDFIKDITTMVPLFTIDGIYYKWSHKSLQEYFTAQFIYRDSGNKRDDILLAMFNSLNIEKYITILDLYYDIDYKTFRNTIEYTLLKEYKEYTNNHYTKTSLPHIEENKRIKRQELSFAFKNICFIATRTGDNSDEDEAVQFNDALHNFDNEHSILTTTNELDQLLPKQCAIYFLCLHKTKLHTISKILKEKKNPLIRDVTKHAKVDKLIIKEFNVAQLINDDATNFYNKIKEFDTISYLLENIYPFFGEGIIPIDNKIALLTLNEIEADLRQLSQTDFLLDGI